MANLLSQGTGIYISDLASPEVFSEIGQVMTISGPDGSASEIDVTNLSSTAKEFVIGLPDEGSVSLEVSFDYQSATAGHDTLHTARISQILQHFQIRLSDSPRTVVDFQAYVTQFSLSLGVDDKVQATFGLRITGAATIT
ncbi:phage tail protein [bacterium]|nr:phage tail protein [bacterium]